MERKNYVVRTNGETFTITCEMADMMLTLKDLISDLEVVDEIDLPNVRAAEFAMIVKYLNYHLLHPGILPEDKPDKYGILPSNNIIDFDRDLMAEVIRGLEYKIPDIGGSANCSPDMNRKIREWSVLSNFGVAVMYVHIPKLEALVCKMLANLLKSCNSTEEMRTMMCEPDDLTREEVDELKKKLEWARLTIG